MSNVVRIKQRLYAGSQRATWAAKHVLRIPPQTPREAFARLSWAVETQPRYKGGRFHFPFGSLEYVDGPSLKWQYWEIFVQRAYDFEARREDPVITDCGGNVGLSTIWFKQRYPGSRISVLEADPRIADVLSANLVALGLGDVRVINAAAWIEDGQVAFARNGADSGRIDAQRGQETIEAVRLADLITQPVDLLKLDIEGAEYPVIRDLCETGKISYVRQLICEIHGRDTDRHELGPLLTALTDHGLSFTLTDARCAPDLPGPPETTPFPFARDGKFLLNLYAWQP